MKNEKICQMIKTLETRADKMKTNLLKVLKTEDNLKKAEDIFQISDNLCFKKDGKYGDIARQQARKTTSECLNVVFKQEKIDFRSRKNGIYGSTLFEDLEDYVIEKWHIRFLQGYTEDETAILFREDIDLAMDVYGVLTWMADIKGKKIRYTLFSDSYNRRWCLDTQSKPSDEMREKVKTWYREHGFTFKED